LTDPVELLRQLVEIESPTYSDGVGRVAARFAEDLDVLGAECRLLEGDHLVAELDGDGEPVLLIGHCDTVWPFGTLEQMPFRVVDGRAHGPGTYDMKGGLVVIVEALRRARRRRAVRVFLTGDEEQGTTHGRPHLDRAAEGVAAAFVLEFPARNGDVMTSRSGIGRFELSITGRPSHAGTSRANGVSAIEELAHQVLRLHALDGFAVNVGLIQGGTTENVVAAAAEARIDVRVSDVAQLARAEEALSTLTPTLNGASVSVAGEWTRPPLERTPGAARLFERARAHAAELGLALGEVGSGGGSDANLLAPLGVPVLDGLGPLGDGAHARHEHVVVESIAVRAELLARLIDDATL
jgi:glutamate carboxypeptidase